MKRFLGFVVKEFYHILRDRRTMAILFGMPLSLVLLFGFVLTNEIKDAQIAILDPNNDLHTLRLRHQLLSSGYFKAAGYLHSPQQIDSVFRRGKVKMVVVFENNFAQKLAKEHRAQLQLVADASDPNTANLLVNYTQAIVASYQQSINQQALAGVQIRTEPRMLYNPEMRGVYLFVPGIMALILMLVSAMMTSISIAREKELGTMEVLLVSPLLPVHILLGKVLPYFALSLVNALTILVLGHFVFGMPIVGSLALLLAETMLFILLALSLGILISTVAKTQQVAMFLSMFALMLPTILLSGFIFPIENMPWPLQWLSYIMPPRYYIVVLKNIMLKGSGLAAIWPETLVLLGMTLALLAAATRKFKTRLE